MTSTPLFMPPYYAVIFTSLLPEHSEEYGETSNEIYELAQGRPGFLGVDSVRDAGGQGATISYWRTEDDVTNFRKLATHRHAQHRGRVTFYERYEVRVAKVEKEYAWKRKEDGVGEYDKK
ncbi:hypothetical protein V1520DRAFT_92678 [Lipomyces starkeyi]|uniref:ABM domain-containing protein n=1 Tax=Lipomyces starkeyi NRRL Y-11557 TaxID=675824 RepID=A0A1E3PXE1_LIPST|nr:hypothetical protein LIPSTDRAFT_174973 [Lipomyces starkeyi NRRL Y-11557]